MGRSRVIKGSKVRLLSPEDNLLQVALHTAKHSFVRAPGFRLHTDVDRIATVENINWEIFTKRVVQLRTKTAVYFSLAMAHELLGTHIPHNVLKTLRPNRFKEKIITIWLKKVGIFNPDEPKWGKFGYIVFVSLLFDDVGDLLGGIFPPPKQLQAEYKLEQSWLLPFYYLKRIFNLAIKRTNT